MLQMVGIPGYKSTPWDTGMHGRAAGTGHQSCQGHPIPGCKGTRRMWLGTGTSDKLRRMGARDESSGKGRGVRSSSLSVCVQQVIQGGPWLWEGQATRDMAHPGPQGTMAHKAHLGASQQGRLRNPKPFNWLGEGGKPPRSCGPGTKSVVCRSTLKAARQD